MKKVLLATILIGALMFSCTDLSEKLYDRLPIDKYPENAAQANLMLIPIFEPLRDYADWGGYWFLQELTAGDIVPPTRHTDWDDGGKWRVLYQHTWSNDVEAINGLWYRIYKGVLEANKLIEFLKPAYDQGTLAAKVTTAKAIAMRSFYLWNGIDIYGDIPYVTKFSQAETNPYRNYRHEVWKAIVKDLEEQVLPYVKYFSNSKYSVSPGMVYTLLAKLYLNANVYCEQDPAFDNDVYTQYLQKAKQYCDSVIDGNYGYRLESEIRAPFVTQNENSPENIFTIGYDEQTYTGFNLHMRTLHYDSQKTFNMVKQPWNGFAATKHFYELFTANDKRKSFFLVGQQYDYQGQPITESKLQKPLVFDPYIPYLWMKPENSTPEQIRMSGVRVNKFEVKLGAGQDLSNDFPIFRLADVYLMRAEILVRLNGPGAGDVDLNKIRQRAGLSAISGAPLDSILVEFRREMFWEAHARYNLIRHGKFLQAWWEKPADDSPTRTIFPIPKWATDNNPNLLAEPKHIQ